MPQTESPPLEETLPGWIARHRVCWEIAPHYHVREGERLVVGFDLTLFAQPPPECRADPGCDGCRQVFEGLRRLVDAVLPPDVRGHVGPFDAAFVLRPESRWEPELTLVLQVRDDDSSGVGAASRQQQVKAIGDALARLGAQPRAWR